MKKILIAVPCMDMVSARFAQSLATLQKIEGTQAIISFLAGSLVYDSRNKLAAMAVNMEADYIMWFDSDMVFAPNTLVKMMKTLDEHPEIDILSGLYFRRATPFTPVLFKKLERAGSGVEYEDYKEIPDGLFEVAGCGFGCVLMKTDCLYGMVDEEGIGNWFEPFNKAGEDCAFCIRAREAGYKVYCDPDIALGHMGYAPVTRSFYEAMKENDNGTIG
ncbi:MAG: hypothetical protein IIY21_02335 [Clostridiales bacterium]|nr:hypothetical protein [Clostridiales bacterium]MBQ1572974.1 hypothetical protein [Clostridiales bacterium]